MKAELKIKEITHTEIVNLISTAAYGSNWLGIDYNEDEYNSLASDKKSKNPCIEEKMADLLLDGKSVEFYDMYCEDKDDFYGNLFHRYDKENGFMFYSVTLKDFINGLEKAATSSEWGAECFCNFVFDDSYNLDSCGADTLIQYVIFGSYIYG